MFAYVGVCVCMCVFMFVLGNGSTLATGAVVLYHDRLHNQWSG